MLLIHIDAVLACVGGIITIVLNFMKCHHHKTSLVDIIGASLSEPHTTESKSSIYLSIYLSSYVCSRPSYRKRENSLLSEENQEIFKPSVLTAQDGRFMKTVTISMQLLF